jgi:hypothetical protein
MSVVIGDLYGVSSDDTSQEPLRDPGGVQPVDESGAERETKGGGETPRPQ